MNATKTTETFLQSTYDGEIVAKILGPVCFQEGQIFYTANAGAYKVKSINWTHELGILSQDVYADPVNWQTKEKEERPTPKLEESEDMEMVSIPAKALETVKNVFELLEKEKTIFPETKDLLFKALNIE